MATAVAEATFTRAGDQTADTPFAQGAKASGAGACSEPFSLHVLGHNSSATFGSKCGKSFHIFAKVRLVV